MVVGCGCRLLICAVAVESCCCLLLMLLFVRWRSLLACGCLVFADVVLFVVGAGVADVCVVCWCCMLWTVSCCCLVYDVCCLCCCFSSVSFVVACDMLLVGGLVV